MATNKQLAQLKVHKFHADATPEQKEATKDLKAAGWEFYQMSDSSVLLRKGGFCDRTEARIARDGSVITCKAGA